MADNDQVMNFDIATPRQGLSRSSGQPLADAEGAEGNSVLGNIREPDGAGGDSKRIRQTRVQPSALAPRRERSVTPRRGGHLLELRGGSSPP